MVRNRCLTQLQQFPLQWEKEYSDLLNETRNNVMEGTYQSELDLQAWSEYVKSDKFVLYRQDLHEAVKSVQAELALLLFYNKGTFSRQWLALPQSIMQNHYFFAMKSVSKAFVHINERKWCPEITLAGLLADEGLGFLELHSELELTDCKYFETKWTVIRNPVVDKMLGVVTVFDTTLQPIAEPMEEYKFIQYAHRMLYLTRVVLQIHKSVEGLDLSFDCYKLQENLQMVHCCAYCTKARVQSAPAFLACGGCNKYGKSRRYCSKQCQKLDWKAGHRNYCGLKGVCHNGAPKSPVFEHTRPLRNLVKFIADNPQVDYGVANWKSGQGVSIQFTSFPEKLHFRIYRTRAIATGDAYSVGVMLRLLQKIVDTPIYRCLNITRDDLLKQLMAEFGVDAEKAQRLEQKPKDMVTETEAREVMEQLERDMAHAA